MNLNGKWKLYGLEYRNRIDNPQKLADYSPIDANVPGNVELDMMSAGILPEDIFKGMNITLAEKYETYQWWYETEFETPEHERNMIIRFDGVDCFAQYWLNGKKIAESDNALIFHEFDITEHLSPVGENNKLYVCINPAVIEANKIHYDIYNIDSHPQPNADGIGIRKPPHCFGWDIMPRAVSAGLYRNVYLYEKSPIEISQLHYHITYLDEDKAVIRFLWELGIDNELVGRDIHINIKGVCENSEFEIDKKVYFKLDKEEVTIENPKLWWPKGYGEAMLYNTIATVTLDGKKMTQKSINVGVRTAVLDRTEETDGINGRFCFVVNGIDIMCKGTNWVPLDVYHSRDSVKYQKALELVSDIGCNMIRCWGGNVYEEDCFYDYCDKHGIMIWQDFTMACAGYRLHDDFYKTMETEAQSVVRRLRTHPSIVLWSGDNECDAVMCEFGANPLENKITREILPMVIHNNDNGRSYLPSSPCFSARTYKTNNYKALSEYHLWGPRDYFKSDYYKQSKAHFVSEIGYHGCPSKESLCKFIDEAMLWPCTDNEQWNLHSSDQRNSDTRVKLVRNQIQQLFGTVPENLEDYILASQISQAEAMKYFIERIRCQKPTKSGLIWWNILDGWPQISDAVVDYYFEKKLAYDYIKASQQDFIIMADEIDNWHMNIVASNDTQIKVTGEAVITEDGREIYNGSFSVGANANKIIAKVPVMYSDKKLYIIKWTTENGNGVNHYICGYPAFDFEIYKNQWLPEIKKSLKELNKKR